MYMECGRSAKPIEIGSIPTASSKYNVMTENEIKKDLYKSKEIATFAYYDGDTAKMHYYIKIFGKQYIFPMSVFEKDDGVVCLAHDLRGAKFGPSIKGSELNRWIMKALNGGDLICLE